MRHLNRCPTSSLLRRPMARTQDSFSSEGTTLRRGVHASEIWQTDACECSGLCYSGAYHHHRSNPEMNSISGPFIFCLKFQLTHILRRCSMRAATRLLRCRILFLSFVATASTKKINVATIGPRSRRVCVFQSFLSLFFQRVSFRNFWS